jgi:hypothetical protein
MVGILKRKTENISIWCDADIFVKCNYLDGLYSGMIISEVEESVSLGFDDIDLDLITPFQFKLLSGILSGK